MQNATTTSTPAREGLTADQTARLQELRQAPADTRWGWVTDAWARQDLEQLLQVRADLDALEAHLVAQLA